jgi:hypothetical protein
VNGHPSKQPIPMDISGFCIVTNDNDEHLEKQRSSMEVTEFGIVTDDKDEHP